MPPQTRSTPRVPSDRRAKATADSDAFTFTHAVPNPAHKTDPKAAPTIVKTFELPSPQEGLAVVSGRVLRDATIGGQDGQLALGFHLLEALNLPEGVLDALYDKPAPETLDIVERWLLTSKRDGVTVPQS